MATEITEQSEDSDSDSVQSEDSVSLYIHQMLLGVSLRHSDQHCIFRVHDLLRMENKKAYEPTIVAIGPYHRGKNNLKSMEKHKFLYLQQVLEFNEVKKVDSYVEDMRDLEKSARNCYADSFDLDKDEFVKMMLLDGFFIIQLLRKFEFECLRDKYPNDPAIYLEPIRKRIFLDIITFENQLPYFILDRLVHRTKSSSPTDNIRDLIQIGLMCAFPFLFPTASNSIIEDSDLPVSSDLRVCSGEKSDLWDPRHHHILGLMHEMLCSSFVRGLPKEKQAEKWEFIKSTTELQEAGVKFKKSTAFSLLDIKFENGVMKIPPLTIDDYTEHIFRNLIAYEQYCSDNSTQYYFTGYIRFLDCLINSANDVKKLRHEEIIVNWMGDDEAVSTMFNKLFNQVMMSDENFCYSNIFNRVNMHCRKRRNIWLANLRRNYFNTPWSIISFIVAIVLLILTMTQTTYSILSYHK